MPSTTITPVTISSALMTELAEPPRSLAALERQLPCECRHERRAHRAFGEQVADEVGDAELATRNASLASPAPK